MRVRTMNKRVGWAIAMLWALCILIRGLAVDLAPACARSASSPTKPAGYEWRKVRRLGGKVVAVRLQILVA